MKISRLNSIEQYVISKETVSIDELCEVFGVSKNTIRRDLNDLEARGHIAKVYGGVTTVGSPGAVPMPVRTSLNSADKNQIGMLAASEVQDGDTIFIDSGSTTVCLLRYLSGRKRVTVITHSLGAMSEASKYDNLSLISLGGYLIAGHVAVGDGLRFLPGSLLGAAAGGLLMRKIPPIWLRRIFGGFLI